MDATTAGRGRRAGRCLRRRGCGAPARPPGLTQEELAARAGLTPNAVGALERGEHRHPYPATVRALADALGLTRRTSARPWRPSVPKRGRPAARPDAAPPGLPAPLSPLIGREREVAAVCRAAPPRRRPAGDADRSRRRRQDPPRPAGRRRAGRGLRRRRRVRAARRRPRPGPRRLHDRPRARRGRGRRPIAGRPPGGRPARPPPAAGPRQLRAPARRGAAGDRPARAGARA